jgi:hypothetical protein
MTVFYCSICENTLCNSKTTVKNRFYEKIKEKVLKLEGVDENSLQFDFEIQRETFIQKYFNTDTKGIAHKVLKFEIPETADSFAVPLEPKIKVNSQYLAKKENGSFILSFT